jgi:hypothetical protein
MDRRNLNFFKIFTFLFLFPIIGFPSFGQDINEHLNQKIQFSKSELTVKQALDELNELPDISIIYSSNDDYQNYKIKFSAKLMTVKSALEEIELQVPIEIVWNKMQIPVMLTSDP